MEKVIILGAGESGVGAALLAKKKNYDVFVSDYSPIADKYKQELIDNDIPFEEKGHTFEIKDIKLVVKSPGVPTTAPIIQDLETHEVRIISEIEFGYLHYEGTILAITGSNGKTTTSGLLHHLLHVGGRDVAIGGNYGVSFARIVSQRQPQYMVLEISSFQLDDIKTFAPDIAILLNISPDHLDRYEYKLENYAFAKFMITRYQATDAHFVYNADDTTISSMMEDMSILAQKHPIQLVDYKEGITEKNGDRRFEISIKGRHNLFNAACAVQASRLIGLEEEAIAEGLATFVNEAHRLEEVDTIAEVLYINDSKATNVEAVYYALDAMESPIIWIVGGVDKGNDYSTIAELVRSKVKAIVCLGSDNQKIINYFQDIVTSICEYTDVYEAVTKSAAIASSGDTVLLSPACASFDLFRNYMDRGGQYKEAVRKLR